MLRAVAQQDDKMMIPEYFPAIKMFGTLESFAEKHCMYTQVKSFIVNNQLSWELRGMQVMVSTTQN